jgi:membrane-bound lytic murein transglycosylase D
MQVAVDSYSGGSQRDGQPLLPPVTYAPQDRVAPAAAMPGGEESAHLARLRESIARERPEEAACELHRPMQSRSPRYESQRDREAPEVDDLDFPGKEALSRLQLPDLRGSITRRTLKFVRFFARTERGRGMFETWLKRSGKYQDMIQAELRDRRLPEDLIWLAMIESGFDAKARSPAGAVGLWQFMPATGEVYGLMQNRHFDQRRNPRLATQAAAHHLRDLYMRFGQWDLALAAYNMGYEQLLNAIDRYGTSDFNELSRQEAIPSETAAYVPKIMAAAIVANNLEHFGFDKVEPSRPVDAAEIAVPPGTPIKALAKAAGVSTSTVRGLNPDILGDRVPPGRGDFLLMVPADTLARARAALPGLIDTDQLGVEDSVLDPVDLVGGREPSRKVRAPSDDDDSLLSLLPPPKRRRALRDALDRDRDDGDDEDLMRPSRKRKGRETVMYKVGVGDTLLGIARQFAVDIDDLARENGLEASSKLREGALLRLRVRADLLEQDTSAAGKAAGAREPKQDDKLDVQPKRAPAVGEEPQKKAKARARPG